MSRSRPPSPIQPHFATAADTMAQVHRPPSLPTSHGASRLNTYPEPGPQLPPLHSLSPGHRPSFGGRGLPSVQLPPMQTPLTTAHQPRVHTSGSLSISQLLSDAPRSPPRSHPGPYYAQQDRHPHEAARQGESPGDPRPYVQTTRQPTQGSTVPHTYGRPISTLQYQQSRHVHESSLAYAYPRQACQSSEPTGHPQFSPVPTSYSSTASHHDGHSEPSPRGSIGPPSAFQMPLAPRMSQVPPYDYRLSIRQQPVAARACGYGERDRRVIDPPPILELRITDKYTGRPEQDLHAMLALHCTLLSPDMKDETETQPEQPGHQTTRRLMGTLVASPYQAKDETGTAGTFFVFPDLSCRQAGRYRLRIKLLRVDPTNIEPGTVHGSVASTVTEVFSVYTAKDFPGMRASSSLLKALRRQGLNVGVKKGSEARKGKGRAARDRSSSPGDDSDDGERSADRRESNETGLSNSEDVSPKGRPNKKPKRKRRES